MSGTEPPGGTALQALAILGARTWASASLQPRLLQAGLSARIVRPQ
jgi:hypothetical protein